MVVIEGRGARGIAVVEIERISGSLRDRPFAVGIRCRIREDRDARPHFVIVVADDLGFQSAGRNGLWPKGEEERVKALGLLALGDALDRGMDLQGSRSEPPVIELETDSYHEPRTPAATNAGIREYVLLKAAWSDKVGERGCRLDQADAWRLGVRMELIHNAEQLLLDEGLITREGPLIRPSLKLIERFDAGQIGHAPPLLAAANRRLEAPRYAAVHEQVSKAIAAFSADDQDLGEAATSAVRAVEGLARIVTNRPTETLGDIIKHLRSTGALRPPLDKLFEGIYGFRGSRPGLAHGGVVPTDTELREATLVYNSAAACIEFLLDLDRPSA